LRRVLRSPALTTSIPSVHKTPRATYAPTGATPSNALISRSWQQRDSSVLTRSIGNIASGASAGEAQQEVELAVIALG